MPIRVKTGTSTWSAIKKVYAKVNTSSTGWRTATKVFAKLTTGWIQVWPGDAPSPSLTDPIDIRTGGYNGARATSPQSINTVLYGNDGTINGTQPIVVNSRRMKISEDSSGNTDRYQIEVVDKYDVTNNQEADIGFKRFMADGWWLFYELVASNPDSPFPPGTTLFSPPIKIIRQQPSVNSSTLSEDYSLGDARLTLDFVINDSWFKAPDLFRSYVKWWRNTSKTPGGTPLKTTFLSDFVFPQLIDDTRSGAQYSEYNGTGTTITGTDYYTESGGISNGNYIIAEIVLVNSFTDHPGNSVVSSFKSTGNVPTITSVVVTDIYGNSIRDNQSSQRTIADGIMVWTATVNDVSPSTYYLLEPRFYRNSLLTENRYHRWDTLAIQSTSTNSGGFPVDLTPWSITPNGSGGATVVWREWIDAGLFAISGPTYGGGLASWSLEFRISARASSTSSNTSASYFNGFMSSIGAYPQGIDSPGFVDISPSSAMTLNVTSTEPSQGSTVTFSGNTVGYPTSTYASYPKRYIIEFGDGTDSGWQYFTTGTSNPGFSGITKIYNTPGIYQAKLKWEPQGDEARSVNSRSITVSPPLSPPTPTGVVWNGTSFVISFTGGSGPWFQGWYRQDNTTYPADGTGYDLGTSTQNTTTMTYTPGFTPTPGATYYFWLRSAKLTNSNTIGTDVSSYSTTRVQVTIPAVATAPTSVTASNNGSSNTITVSWSGATNAAFYRIYWGGATAPTDPGVSFDEEKAVNGSTITASSGSWAWGPGDRDKNNNSPVFGGNYYFYVSASANGTTWTPYVRTSGITNLALTPPTSVSVTPGPQGGAVTATFSGGSGPNYQMYWIGSATAPTGQVTPDATGSSSPLTDNTGPAGTTTVYMYIRSVIAQGDTSAGASSTASAWSAGVPFNMTSTEVSQNSAPTTRATSTFSTTTVKYLDSITWSAGTYTNAASITSVLLYALSTNTGNLVSPGGNTNTLTRTSNPYVIQTSDPAGTPYVFAVRDTVVGTNGTTYYFYSNQITSANADAVAFSYGAATSAAGGWTASVNSGAQTGASYSFVSATTGSATVNASTGAITASGLGSNVSSTVTVNKSVSGYNTAQTTASGTSSTVASFTITYNGNGNTGGSTTATTGNGSVTLRANGFTRTNCTFQGWSTSSTGGVTNNAGTSFNLTANTTLWAVWAANANSATAPTGFKFDGNNLPSSGRKRWSWTGPGTVTGGTATGFRVQISSTSSSSGFTTVAESPLSIGARSYSVAVSPVTSARWLRVAMVYTNGLGATVNSPTFTAAL
jgi:hypothetical protein